MYSLILREVGSRRSACMTFTDIKTDAELSECKVHKVKDTISF